METPSLVKARKICSQLKKRAVNPPPPLPPGYNPRLPAVLPLIIHELCQRSVVQILGENPDERSLGLARSMDNLAPEGIAKWLLSMTTNLRPSSTLTGVQEMLNLLEEVNS